MRRLKTTITPHGVRIFGFAFAAWSSSIAIAAAQTDAPADREEIIVTASRQGAVNVQNAPIAISVVNIGSVERQGGQGFDSYLTSLPSVALDETSPGQNKFNIRGLSAGQFNLTDTQDRTLVSVYLDETPISIQGSTPDLKVFDLERVEVVRGPQGTLYGAGAMAGNIRLVTTKPNLSTYSGSIESTLADTAGGGLGYTVRGLVNAPIVEDKVGVRISVYDSQEPGYINNLGTGTQHANGDVQIQTRGAIRLTPTDNLTIDGSLTYSHLRTRGLPVTLSGLGYDYKSNIDEGNRDDLIIYNLTGAYDLDFANLSSSTSFTDRSFGEVYSWQYALHRYVYKKYTDAQTQSIIAPDDIGNKLRDFDEEVKINSKGDGPLHWIGGVFFESQHRGYDQNIVNPGIDNYEGPAYSALVLGAPVADDAYYGTQNVTERQVAVFGELKYDITSSINATVGARYFDFTQDFNLRQAGLEGDIYPAKGAPFPLTSAGNSHETGVNPRFALQDQLTDTTMLFAEVAKGYRYGGVNYPLPNTCALASQAPATFAPDKLWSYQVGEKSTLMDNRLTLNVTGYWINWYNVQTRKIDTSCSYYYLVSNGSILSRGLELESTLKVTPQLTLTVNASYTDSTADGAIPNASAVDGNRAPYTPEYIASMAVDYLLPVGQDSIDFNLNWRYKGDEQTNFSPAGGSYFQLPPNNQVNLSVSYISDRYEIGVYGRNILNTKEVLDEGTNYVKLPAITNYGSTIRYGRPATVGLRAKINF